MRSKAAEYEYAAYMREQERQKLEAQAASDFISDNFNPSAMGLFSVAHDPISGLLLASYQNVRFFIFDTLADFKMIYSSKYIDDVVLTFYRLAKKKAP